MPPPLVRDPAVEDNLPPALPVIELRSATVGSLRHAPAARWREVLLAAGLLAEVDSTDDPHDPRAWMAALQGLLHELVELEDKRDSLVWVDERPFLYDAPWWMWLLVVSQPCLASRVAHTQTDDIDQVIAFGVVYIIPMLLLVGLLTATYLIIRRRQTARRDELAAVKRRIEQIRADLADGATRTLARDFVASAGPRLLVCVPSLTRASPALAQQLTDQVEAFKRAPPDTWVDLDLTEPECDDS
jgi:hypothetical protein